MEKIAIQLKKSAVRIYVNGGNGRGETNSPSLPSVVDSWVENSDGLVFPLWAEGRWLVPWTYHPLN
jgi:hypothetical protein